MMATSLVFRPYCACATHYRPARLRAIMYGRTVQSLVKSTLRKTLGFPSEGADIFRYTMYRTLIPLLEGLATSYRAPGRLLAVSGGGPLAAPFRNRGFEIVETSYPDIDWQNLPFAASSFDVVLSDQVLEHIADPFRCAAESRRVLRPGGLQVHTTCLVNPIHDSPGDNYRFTPDGLRLVFAPEREITAGGWGNPLAPLMWLLPSVGFRPVPVARRNPLSWLAAWNSERWPVVTWYVGKTPAEPTGAIV
jgi:SAM-dependent methyltransferase